MGRRSDIKPLPSQEALLRLLDYNPESGVLTWKWMVGNTPDVSGFNNRCGGKVAGTVRQKCNYLSIGIRPSAMAQKSIYYYAHRLIWKMMTGEDPSDQIDHRDGDRLNNRWLNLRDANNGKNLANSKLREDNTSGFKGVVFRKRNKFSPWCANITVNKTLHYLGSYATQEAAGAARDAAAKRLHGEFARAK